MGTLVATTGRFYSRDCFVGFACNRRRTASLGRLWSSDPPAQVEASNINDLMWQRQQVIDYWNQRVELNKARWSPEMREKFERTMRVIDQARGQFAQRVESKSAR